MCEREDEDDVLEDSLALSVSEAPGDLSTLTLPGLGGGGLPGLLRPPAPALVTGISSGSEDPDLEVSLVAGSSSLMVTWREWL